MKKAVSLIILWLVLGVLNAQQHYQFRTNNEQGFHIGSSSAEGLQLHYALSEISILNIVYGDAKGQEISLKGSFGSFAEGMPNLPFENRYIAVPQGATVSVKVKEKGCQTLTGIDLLPVAPLQGDSAVGMPRLTKDMSVFGKDAHYPSENVVIAQTTQIRGLDVVLLHVTPFRYNPVKKTLDVIYDMDIDVSFEGGNGQFGDPRYRNPDWDGILRDLVINSDMLPEAHYYDLLHEAVKNKEEGCEYLIISPDDDSIVALADQLKQFRTKQGVLTKVVTTTECGGNDASAIKSYIKNAYEHWTIPPAAVMIFSGVDTLFATSTYYAATSGIPGFNLLFKNYNDGYSSRDYYYSSDNPYADMNDDSIPDITLSRLPAINLDDYKTQVNKIIQYETNPPTQLDYYDRPLITSSYEHNKWFLITSQSVNGFYRNKLGRHPKNFYMIYAQSDPIYPETEWSTDPNTGAVVDYFGPNGQNYIAQSPDTLQDWRNAMDESYLVEALNQSSFLTLYRDHSSFDLWCSPWMYSSEIKHLTSTEPTFVISIGCDAALYSKAIFYETNHNQIYFGQDPMIYEFCNAKTGALGGIGAVTVTHSHFNDILTWGVIDHFWPNYMPDKGTMTQPLFTRPSYALVAGKLFLNQHVFLPNWWPVKVTTTQNVFHDLGDAYLNLYTEVPHEIAMEAGTFTTDPSQYTFTAEEGATVCLSLNEEILSVIQGTGQPQTVSLPNLPIGTHLWLTATKQNCVRFEKEVIVIASDQPYVYVKEFCLNSNDDNGQFDAGEMVDIDIVLHNYSNFDSDKGTLTLRCESSFVELTQNTASYPSLGPDATFKIKKAFRFKSAENVVDQQIIPFFIQFDENENTHEDHFSITLNAPVIRVDSICQLHSMEGEPTTHIIPSGTTKLTYRITNEGHAATAPMRASLAVKAPFIVIEEPSILVEPLAPNEEKEISFLLKAEEESRGAWVQTHFELVDRTNHQEIESTMQYGGIFENFETDTLNPLFRWNNNSNRWQYSDEDACEGQRCLILTTEASDILSYPFKASFSGNKYLNHEAKISFRYKTGENDTLRFGTANSNYELNSPEWCYSEFTNEAGKKTFTWSRSIHEVVDDHVSILKIDDICFPPQHRVIAHAGESLIHCGEAGVELHDAYAYDGTSYYWTTEGDGHFEQDTLINPIYYPGTSDLQEGLTALTLHALNGSDTVASTITLTFLDEILLDSIIGDSLVNIYTQPISHYSIKAQEGVRYIWALEPAHAGWLYANGNEVDILWNRFENITTTTLSVTTDNGCEVAPSTLYIQTIGHSTSEQPSWMVKVFPNPTDGKVNLVCEETLLGKVQLEVFNLMGERIVSRPMSHLMKGEQVTLDLSSYASGIYLIKLSSSQGNYLQKVSLR